MTLPSREGLLTTAFEILEESAFVNLSPEKIRANTKRAMAYIALSKEIPNNRDRPFGEASSR